MYICRETRWRGLRIWLTTFGECACFLKQLVPLDAIHSQAINLALISQSISMAILLSVSFFSLSSFIVKELICGHNIFQVDKNYKAKKRYWHCAIPYFISSAWISFCGILRFLQLCNCPQDHCTYVSSLSLTPCFKSRTLDFLSYKLLSSPCAISLDMNCNFQV